MFPVFARRQYTYVHVAEFLKVAGMAYITRYNINIMSLNFGPHLKETDIARITVANENVLENIHERYEVSVRILIDCFSFESAYSFVV